MADASGLRDAAVHYAPRVIAGPAGVAPPPGFLPIRLVLEPSGMALDVERTEIVVGRHSSCDVCLPLPDVSRRHCRLFFRDGQWLVEDRGSLNGVFVNEERVKMHALRTTDRLRLGGFTFLVSRTGENAGYQGEEQVLRSIASALPEPLRKAS